MTNLTQQDIDRADETWRVQLAEINKRFNDNHVPAGSPEGGEFTSGDGGSISFTGEGWLKTDGTFVSKPAGQTHGTAAIKLGLGGAVQTDGYEVAANKALVAGNVRVVQSLVDEGHFWFHGRTDNKTTRDLIAKAIEKGSGLDVVGVQFDYPRDDSRIEWDDVSPEHAITLLRNHSQAPEWMKFHDAETNSLRFNDNHVPAGSPEGGQFTSAINKRFERADDGEWVTAP